MLERWKDYIKEWQLTWQTDEAQPWCPKRAIPTGMRKPVCSEEPKVGLEFRGSASNSLQWGPSVSKSCSPKMLPNRFWETARDHHHTFEGSLQLSKRSRQEKGIDGRVHFRSRWKPTPRILEHPQINKKLHLSKNQMLKKKKWHNIRELYKLKIRQSFSRRVRI